MLYYGNSDVGMKRQINQDNFLTIPVWGGEGTLLVVCDGMGGHKAGDVASKKAIEAFANSVFLNPCSETDEMTARAFIKYVLVSSSDAANRVVYTLSQEQEEYHGMGTTLVAALIYHGHMYAINIGDSRLYMITKYKTMQISHDHSFVQYLIDNGKLTEEEAKTYPRRNVITRAIGVGEKAEVDFFCTNLSEWEGGYLLLCSDGLSNYTDSQLLFDVIYGDGPKDDETESDIASKVNKLISIANNNGGADNITAVIGKF
ncbi:MAG: Stp1/IreP family PP2C-type Ser/Thr phosphatase [Clostridia bacterium]|nr:Stp1/IreP family PP2C-type Ser/Thr phosphatase [Clostridia bacterium]